MIIKTNKEQYLSYLKDTSNYKGNAEKLFIPENEDEILQVVNEANNESSKITISGNRTGLSGSAVPEEGYILSFERMNKILEFNIAEKSVLLEPGVILSELLNTFNENNLYYPPDPTEKNCQIGGTVATNASGAKTFKYGSTRNFVEYLEIITATGEKIDIRRGENFFSKSGACIRTKTNRILKIPYKKFNYPNTSKNSAGYYLKEGSDVIDLFIGSEGTLGIISKIRLKLLEKPLNKISLMIFFKSEKEGLLAISKIKNSMENNSSNFNPSLIEFFDSFSLDFIRDKYNLIKENFECALWIEEDFNISELEKTEFWYNFLITVLKIDDENIIIALDEKDKNILAEMRHEVSERANEFISKYNMIKVGTDVAVPDKYFTEFYFTIKKLALESGIRFITYGHFGNSHIHLNMLPINQLELGRAKIVYKKICEIAVGYNGTVSAEHGLGKIKSEYLPLMFSLDEIKDMVEIKKTLDPKLTLGYGNIIPKRFYQ